MGTWKTYDWKKLGWIWNLCSSLYNKRKIKKTLKSYILQV